MNRNFTAALIDWQRHAGRHDLPWQGTPDAYRIWLSEIMLQQTQVATVIPYYQRFLARFPDVQALAAASIDTVIAHWAGLGYYARARNLHRCAQVVVAEHGGHFPADPAQLAALPGIGRTTAAAIAAFAYGRRAAILDGNVKRVLCRHFAITGFPGASAVDRELWQLADGLLPTQDIGTYTQALMDLGATVCTRQRPRCGECPVNRTCRARQEGRQAELPHRRPSKPVPFQTASFLLISDGQQLLLQRRPPTGLWGGLLVPPEGPPARLASFGLRLVSATPLPPVQHAFTHFRLTIEPLWCEVVPGDPVTATDLVWIARDQAAEAGLPTPFRKLLKPAANAAD